MGDLLKSFWAREQADGNDMQSLANTVWAITKAGQSDAQLFMALAKVAERSVSNFNTQDLANTAWAFATAGQSDAVLFTALANAAEQRMDDFDAQSLANTA